MSDVMFLIIAGGAVLVGSAVQGSIGLGLGLIAAPVVSLLDPALIPGTVLITTALLPALTLTAEWRHVDLRGVSWALAGRFVGTIGGVWVVAVLTPQALGGLVGLIVLVAVALTVSTVRVRPTRVTLSVAGLISGVAGTATSIGGPPVALVYQHDPGPRVRSTLSAYFVVGVFVSLGALAIGGQLEQRDVVTGLTLLPFVVVGFLLARPLRRAVDGHRLRAALLIVVT
ncbi:MAG TPA: sulfite exporter TauE/SafE family protein, partial [Jiangellaceae bacterium]|nr:sulfite exporter TauE/SafE family protein [Jiangellaceae bacterium]